MVITENPRQLYRFYQVRGTKAGLFVFWTTLYGVAPSSSLTNIEVITLFVLK